MSPLLRLYLAASHLTGPVWRLNHRRRLKRGKEVPERLPEKYGTYPVTPCGKPVLWFHALSVGESFALLPLVDLALERLPEAEVVLTTSTASSVEALAKANLPERCHHILLPIDTPAATRAFLDHWCPNVAAFAELDFWPRLMVETARRDIPMVLVNSRLPDKNFERRQRLDGMIRDVVRLFDALLVQDDLSRDRFVQLGAAPERVEVVGALKAAARPLAADESALNELRAAIGQRPVWCAAATEASEHVAMIEAHKQVSDQLEQPLLILAPRFREDGNACDALAREAFAQVARRRAGEPLTADTQVYIADTFGEMGLWYRLAPVSFIGHSLTAGLEGKNPFEGAALGSALLTGPHVSYFSESFQALYTHDACVEVTDAKSLAEAVIGLQDANKRGTMTRGAEAVIAERTAVLTRTWAAIDDRLSAA